MAWRRARMVSMLPTFAQTWSGNTGWLGEKPFLQLGQRACHGDIYIYMVIMLCHTDLLVILLRFEALVSNSLVSVEMFRTSTCHLLMWSANLLPPTHRPAIKCQRNRFREPYFWQTLYTILLHPAQVWPVTVHQDSLRKLPPSSRHHSEWPETFFCFSSWLPPKTKTTIWSKANEGSTYEGWGLCLPYAREKFEDLQITI